MTNIPAICRTMTWKELWRNLASFPLDFTYFNESLYELVKKKGYSKKILTKTWIPKKKSEKKLFQFRAKLA